MSELSVDCNWGAYVLNPEDGVTSDAVDVFTRGQCHALALALHEIVPESELCGVGQDYDTWEDESTPQHVLVRLPDGRYLDVEGAHPERIVTDTWFERVGDGEIQPLDRERALGAFDGRYWDPDLDAGRAFAPAVLAEYAPEFLPAN